MVVSTRDQSIGVLEIGVLAAGEDSLYLAMVFGGTKVATFTKRISLFRIARVEGGLDALCASLPRRSRGRIASRLKSGGRFTHAQWRDLRPLLVRIQPRLEELERIQDVVPMDNPALDDNSDCATVLEREAIGFAVEAWAGNRTRKETLLDCEPLDARAPFIRQIEKAHVVEADAIAQDCAHVPGFQLIKKYVVGAALFSDGATRLTILNANMKPLERHLGVDLIYYNHRFRSYVLIQYKRMAGMRKKRPCYFPDSDANFAIECDRIRSALGQIRDLPRTKRRKHTEVRIGANPFYFKFCDLSKVRAVTASLAPGFYLPFGLVGPVLRSKRSKGVRGGRAIGWDTAGRFLSNGRMLELIRGGWIGSRGPTTTWLEAAVRACIEGNRSLIYALTSPQQGGTLIHRDPLGRYATSADSSASPDLQ